MLLIAALSSVLSQDLILECDFFESWQYECEFNHITVEDPTQNIIIGGTHLEGRTDDDVRIVWIRNSNTPFMIQQIFTTFPNLDELYIHNSSLASINIPESAQLSEVYLDNNNITRIQNGAFGSQSNLWYLNLRENNIQEIEEDAFLGLSALETLNLIGNHIETLAPRTLHPLTNLTVLDFERNSFTSINDEWFSQNSRIRILFLEFNQIDEVSPRFFGRFDNLEHVDFSGNVCVNRNFYIENDDDFSVIGLHNALRRCYNNFVGEVSEMRRVTFEFVGSMRLFDEFGNLVANV